MIEVNPMLEDCRPALASKLQGGFPVAERTFLAVSRSPFASHAYYSGIHCEVSRRQKYTLDSPPLIRNLYFFLSGPPFCATQAPGAYILLWRRVRRSTILIRHRPSPGHLPLYRHELSDALIDGVTAQVYPVSLLSGLSRIHVILRVCKSRTPTSPSVTFSL